MERIQAIRGMNDVLPEQSVRWQYVEDRLRQVLTAYGYREIRTPLLEKTELFQRSIGDVTDIVEKEMYSFEDRGGESLTLRPEGTAGCLRACLEHGLLHNQIQRLWYMGSMFRYERPQAGRYRQFHQLGVEAFGMPGPDIDAELILLSRRFWSALGIEAKLELQINSLGTTPERLAHRTDLVAYFRARRDQLDEDSQRRLETNPLRILDSKNPELQALIEAAPKLIDFLGEESRGRFERLQDQLSRCGLSFTVNPRLVRGLDYYSLTVFEWVTRELGAQGTVCGGGRYDGLVEQLGGKGATAIGLALGMERLISLVGESAAAKADTTDAYLICVGAEAEAAGLALAENLRDALPRLRLQANCGGGSFKSQFKRADRSGATVALILGDDEIQNGTVAVKKLRVEGEQTALPRAAVADYLLTLIQQNHS